MVSDSSSGKAKRGGGEEGRSSRSFTYGEYFREACPYYLAAGMDYALYWDGEVDAAQSYYKADRLRAERENEAAWLHGLYVRLAIVSSFGDGKHKPPPYPERPIGTAEGEQTDGTPNRTRKKKNAQQTRDEALFTASMMAWMNDVNRKIKKKEAIPTEKG